MDDDAHRRGRLDSLAWTTASVATAAVPVSGALLAIPLVGEWPSPSAWVGLATVCGGIAVANLPGATRAPGRAAPEHARSASR